MCQHAAGFDADGVVIEIDGAYPIHAPEIEHDARTCCARYRRATQTGVAALWHDRGASRGAQLDDGGNFFAVARFDNGQCVTAIAATPVREIRRHRLRIGDDGIASGNGIELFDEWARHSYARIFASMAVVERSC